MYSSAQKMFSTFIQKNRRSISVRKPKEIVGFHLALDAAKKSNRMQRVLIVAPSNRKCRKKALNQYTN